MHINLGRLRTFIVVARTGNLSTAAKELGASQPNIGRQMTALEKEVNLTLFDRHSRGIVLTKQGQEYLALCHDVVGRFVQETDVIREKDTDPSGALKVIGGPGILDGILKKLPRFHEKFPNVNFSFLPETDIYQLKIGNSDVALDSRSLHDPEFIRLPLFDMALRIYASPTYLKSHGAPKDLEDLKSHRVVIYEGEDSKIFNGQLPEEIIQNPKIFVMVPDILSMRTALTHGVGIGCFGYNKDTVNGNLLVDVFPDMADRLIPYYYTYHRRLEGSPKIKAFYEFLKEEVVDVWQRP